MLTNEAWKSWQDELTSEVLLWCFNKIVYSKGQRKYKCLLVISSGWLKPKQILNFCDTCNLPLNATAFSKHLKTNKHLGTLYENDMVYYFPVQMKEWPSSTTRELYDLSIKAKKNWKTEKLLLITSREKKM